MSLILASTELRATLAFTKNDRAAQAAVVYLAKRYATGRFDGLRYDVVTDESRGIEFIRIMVYGSFSDQEMTFLTKVAEAFLEGFREPYEAIKEI